MRRLIIVVAAIALLSGCSRAIVTQAQGPNTNVTLMQKNYRMLKTDCIGDSHGFTLLGIIPMWRPTAATAIRELNTEAALPPGKAYARINEIQEKTSTYLILFSIPAITVRADIIEFLDETDKAQPSATTPPAAAIPPAAK